MYRSDGVVTWVRRLPSLPHVVLLLVMLAAVLPLSALSVLISFPGSAVAAWWPAAGLCVVIVLCARRKPWAWALGIVAVTAIGNVLGGRPPTVSVGFGIANAAEALVVALVVSGRGWSVPELQTVGRVLRLLLATAVGALTIGLGAGLIVALLEHGDGVGTFVSVATSHAAAVLVIVPLVLVGREPVNSATWERIAQPVLLAVAVAVGFLQWSPVSLAFVPVPVLAWAALRFGYRAVTWELAGTTVVVTLITRLGLGPFGPVGDHEVASGIALAFILVNATAMLLLACARSERERLAQRAFRSDQELRAVLQTSPVGVLLVALESGGRVGVVRSNAAARDLLGLVGEDDVAGGVLTGEVSELAIDAAGSETRDAQRTLRTPDGARDMLVFASAAPSMDGRNLVSVQVVDATEQEARRRATLEALAREQEGAEKLRALNQRQEDFILTVSHELRTPITSIVGYTEELAELDLGDEAHGYVEVVERNARRLSSLVEELLETRSKAIPSPVAVEAVAVSAIVSACLQDLQPFALSHGVEVVVDGAEDVTTLTHRPDAVTKVLVNLLTNAIKYSPRGSLVEVRVRAEGDAARVVIADHGRGIPPEQLASVFDRFYRAPGTEAVAGVGLGLTIVKRLVDDFGGTIELDSDGESGTTATLLVPLS